MPLLPLRLLPVNDAHDGPYAMRIEIRPSGSAYVYVRRESDKKTWLCTVRTLQEILAPSQEAHSLDFVAVIMCLYHGIAYDSSSSAFTTGPVELRRREVAYTQPETWTDGGYRLTMRVSVRSTTIATPLAQSLASQDDQAPMATIPIVDVVENDVVFGLNFAVTDMKLHHTEVKLNKSHKIRRVTLTACTTTFPNAFIQWYDYKDTDFLRVANDGVYYRYDGVDRIYAVNPIEIEVHIIHAKNAGPALFVLSVNAKFVQVNESTMYTASDFQHTVARYSIKVPASAFVQITMLPGSTCALNGTTMTIRELGSLY